MGFRVGTSGWQYRHWKGVFYPEDVAQKRWFEYYATQFHTVEINATYYRLMPEKTFEGWRDRAPEGFLYAVKMWRMVTHHKRLVGVNDQVKDFLDRASRLEDRLGPILIQLPPSFRRDVDRLKTFLTLLGQDHEYAMEFRHPSWFTDEVYDVLRKRKIALCVFHHVEIDCPREVTAPLVYLRFHGESGRYAGKYSTGHLRDWAAFIRKCIGDGHHVAAYFNNDVKGHAVADARELRAMVEKPSRQTPAQEK